MRRKIEQRLLDWKKDHRQKALVVTGPRQVGKTYSLKKFASEHYRNSVYINFEDTPDMKDLFEGSTEASSLFERLSYRFDVDFNDDCVILLDEIQMCPRAVSALKPLAIDGRCDIMASGSLLGNMTMEGALSPMGYTDTIVMDPMDFEEFLWAMSISEDQTESISEHVRSGTPLDGYILGRLTDMFRRYIVVGGMPEAVKTYVDRRDYTEVTRVLEGIYKKICDDAKKYAPRRADKMRIQDCLDSVPRQLSNDKKVFNYSDILMKKGYGRREYGSSLLWLRNAGIIDVCHNLEEPVEPLSIRSRNDSFRVYMKDTGILTYMMGPDTASGIVNGDFFMNNGALMENVVAESLIRKGYDIYFYLKERRRNPDGTTTSPGIELDFVVNMNGKVTAIEVKSGTGRKSKSLVRAVTSLQGIDRGMKLSNSNISLDENGIEHYPLFAISFIEERRIPDLGPVDYIDDLIKALDRDLGKG